jgi:hypothetical protein
VIADAAARRATVTRGCASGTERSKNIVEETSKNGFRTKADEVDADEEAIMLAYIDLIQEEEKEKYGDNYIPVSRENPAGSQGAGTNSTPHIPPNPPASSRETAQAPIDLTCSPTSPPSDPSSSRSTGRSWTCDICTLINAPTHLCCDACGTERPLSYNGPSNNQNPSNAKEPHPIETRIRPTAKSKNPPNSSIKSLAALSRSAESQPAKPLGWLCHRCGTWMESEWWTCARCSTMKQSS